MVVEKWAPLTVSDEKNIRRRVYDACNCLVALQVIEKKARKIYVWNGLQRLQAGCTPGRAPMMMPD
jgi:hypothetical protein